MENVKPDFHAKPVRLQSFKLGSETLGRLFYYAEDVEAEREHYKKEIEELMNKTDSQAYDEGFEAGKKQTIKNWKGDCDCICHFHTKCGFTHPEKLIKAEQKAEAAEKKLAEREDTIMVLKDRESLIEKQAYEAAILDTMAYFDQPYGDDDAPSSDFDEKRIPAVADFKKMADGYLKAEARAEDAEKEINKLQQQNRYWREKVKESAGEIGKLASYIPNHFRKTQLLYVQRAEKAEARVQKLESEIQAQTVLLAEAIDKQRWAKAHNVLTDLKALVGEKTK